MSKKDFYETLGVSKSASQDEIKSAYKKMAMKYHPDRNHDNRHECENKLKEINEAYDTLKDENKRAQYDRFGHSDGNQGGFGGGFSGFGGFDDIFQDINQMFGGGGRSSSKRRGGSADISAPGSDLRYTLQVNLEEVYTGVEKLVSFRALGKCGDCNGKGGEGTESCNECGGSGVKRYQQGFFIVENTCNKCNGSGVKIKNPCKKCRGEGRHDMQYEVNVNIPKGVSDGDNLRVQAKGEAGTRGGRAGDLFVVIKLKDHDLFTREKDNLYCDVPLKFTTAILGGEIKVPTINGDKTSIHIPHGTQYGDKIRVLGKGMPRYNSNSYGDMYVIAKIETPVNLTKGQKSLLEELDGTFTDASNPKSKGFFEKAKKFFG